MFYCPFMYTVYGLNIPRKNFGVEFFGADLKKDRD